MGALFVRLYTFLAGRLRVFVGGLLFLVVFSFVLLLRVGFKEDASSIIPRDERINAISDVFNSSELADRIVVTFSLSDSVDTAPLKLLDAGRVFFDSLAHFQALIEGVEFAVDQQQALAVFDVVQAHLPFYLSDKDYGDLEGLLNDSSIMARVEAGYRSLISPAGFATGRFFFKDPLGLVAQQVQQLSAFNVDDNFELYNGHVFTRDHRNLLLFIDPAYPASNTRENATLVAGLKDLSELVDGQFENVGVQVYGGTVVAVENARQVKTDIVVTVGISLVFLTLLFWFYFRQLRVLLFLFVPVVIGAVGGLLLLSLLRGEVSVISLGVGAILLGISVDYALHVFTHLKESGSIKETLQKVAAPVLISSITTASALLCISVLKAEALEQLSLFATFGILFSAAAALIVLPQLVRFLKPKQKTPKTSFFSWLAAYPFHTRPYLVFGVLIFSVVLLFFVPRLRFNGDIATLNHQSDEVARAEQALKRISAQANSNVFAFSHGESLNEALEQAGKRTEFFKGLQAAGSATALVSVAGLVPDTSFQQQKIAQWRDFWTWERQQALKTSLARAARHFKIKSEAFAAFTDLVERDFQTQRPEVLQEAFGELTDSYITRSGDTYYVATVLKAAEGQKAALLEELAAEPDLVIYDQQLFINRLLDILKEDFNKLSLLSMGVVFLVLLLYFGRIELALVTFIPILLGWFWTLGWMGLLGLSFNIFNVIISSFVFGLGLDYSIFLVSGLVDDYKYGAVPLARYKLSVLMSALTTLGGFGVLVFARHPAIQSIALVSIIGIGSALVITFILTPFLFNWLIASKGVKRKQPVVLRHLLFSLLVFVVFLLGALIMTLLLPLLLLLPFKRSRKKLMMAWLISRFSKGVVALVFPIRKRFLGLEKLDFSKPSVLISNHQSHLDLVLLLMLHPKIIVFTNEWVYNNVFYGALIRFADYFPAYRGLEAGFARLQDKVREGYSVLIFPEGHRTPNGQIQRFHQGAFRVADELGLEIQPLLIHGAYDCLPKTEFLLRPGTITLQVLDRIRPESESTPAGITYRKQARRVCAQYREALAKMAQDWAGPAYYRNLLRNQYLYKGPVLEWYARIKMGLEKDYAFYDQLLPKVGKIVDVGCGYGFLCQLLRLRSKEREVLGMDYDEEKIAVAQNLSIRDEGLQYRVGDVSKAPLPAAQAYVFNDVLHYLPKARQLDLIEEALKAIPVGGMVVIRDADADMKRRTLMTRWTEFQSTRLFRFNRAENELSYLSGRDILALAQKSGLSCELMDRAYLGTSNVTFVLRK